MIRLKDLSPLELLLLIKNLINKKKVTFIQIGVNDGVDKDIAKDVLSSEDIGFFFEPIEDSFNEMVINKKEYNNSVFIKKALLPESLRDNNLMNLLTNCRHNMGASFININEDRIYTQVKVDTITIKNFIHDNNISDLDFLFCDAETLDHLIIEEILNYILPNVIFFETCWWCHEDSTIESSNGTIVKIPSRINIKNKLVENGYYVIDYWESENYKQEDILAVKNTFIEKLL